MIDHKHIIKLYHAFVNNKKLVMIMELAGGGELRDYVESQGRLSECESRRLM